MIDNAADYAPKRFRDIAKERYLISKHINTSYEDTKDISPLERNYLLEFIVEDLERQKAMYDKAKQELEQKRKS